MNPEFELLQTSWLACSQRVDKLKYSLTKNQTLFPLALESLQLITDAQEESIDALILRYSQCVTMIQDQIFKGIAYLEHEDISDKSNRDKALLMEKLGAIRSAEEFGTAALLRNKFAHHYPEMSKARLARLNLLPIEAALVIETFSAIEKYLKNKQFL